MRTTFSYLLLAAVLCVLAPAGAHAANLSLTVYCPPNPGPLGSTTDITPPFVASVNCPLGFSSASASGNTPVGITVQTNGNGQAEYTDVVEVTFSGGTGLGYYVPCLHIGYDGYGGSGAQFGPIGLGSKFPAGGTCFSPLVLEDRVAFTFGVPFTSPVFLIAGSVANGLGGGFGLASLNGFLVFDANGNPLPSATWTATEAVVPEPSFFVPAGLGLLIAVVLKRSASGSMNANASEMRAARRRGAATVMER